MISMAIRRMIRAVPSGLALTAALAVATASMAAPVTVPSQDARTVVAWINASHDTGGRPFAVVDKVEARVFVFTGAGILQSSSPALLGMARGDTSAPGIGDRPLSEIVPGQRTTPAGRFEAALGRNMAGHQVLWVDYAAAISLHAVVTNNPKEHRLQRLATPTSADNRISYGCINVPARYFAEQVIPMFEDRGGIVYILPETLPIGDVFALGSKDAAVHAPTKASR